MSKVDEASWVTLSITLTPDDIFEIQDAIEELECSSGMKSGVLNHIVEQYKLKVESRKQALANHEMLHKSFQVLYTRKLT
jgi:hypothetical protein